MLTRKLELVFQSFSISKLLLIILKINCALLYAVLFYWLSVIKVNNLMRDKLLNYFKGKLGNIFGSCAAMETRGNPKGRILFNVPSKFVKSVCAKNFLCATIYQHSYIFRMPCMKYVQKHFLKENLCVLQDFLCALISRPLCMCTRAQLKWEH